MRIAIDAMGWIRQELRQFAMISEASFIDVAAEIPPTEMYLTDMIHLTKKGEQELGRILTRELLPVVDDLAQD
jgi:hypothetical protein